MDFKHVAYAREEVISLFVEGYYLNLVIEVEGFLNPITMMDTGIDVVHQRVVLEHFQHANYNVIDIEEARSFKVLGLVQNSSLVMSASQILFSRVVPCRDSPGKLIELKELGKHCRVLAHMRALRPLMKFCILVGLTPC